MRERTSLLLDFSDLWTPMYGHAPLLQLSTFNAEYCSLSKSVASIWVRRSGSNAHSTQADKVLQSIRNGTDKPPQLQASLFCKILSQPLIDVMAA